MRHSIIRDITSTLVIRGLDLSGLGFVFICSAFCIARRRKRVAYRAVPAASPNAVVPVPVPERSVDIAVELVREPTLPPYPQPPAYTRLEPTLSRTSELPAYGPQ